MAITFAVDDVSPAPGPAPTAPLRKQLGEIMASGCDLEMRVVDIEGGHPLLSAVHRAFAEHRPLLLSPDAVWLTLAQGLTHHVRLHAEQLRGRLTTHPGRKTLQVVRNGPPPEDPADLADMLDAFRAALAEEVGAGRTRLLLCDFTTTTDVERVASEIVLLDAFSPYFDYQLACVCGIPELTLTGTPADWRSIRARLEVVAELDLEWWVTPLRPILDRLVEASEGAPDRAFFQGIYKPRKAYGWGRITGWITRFFPYLGNQGRYTERNPMLALPLDWTSRRVDDSDWYQGPGLISSDVPPGPGSCLIAVKDEISGARFDYELRGGLLAVEQDELGRLCPRAGWIARRSSVSMQSVVERLREQDWARPATVTEPLGFAEITAFYDAVGEAMLFDPPGSWWIRPLQQHVMVDVCLRDQVEETVRRFIDLPDGSCLAYGSSEGGLYIVRLRCELIHSVPQSEVDEVTGLTRLDTSLLWQTSEDIHQIPIVGRELATLLSQALSTGGAIELPILGTLFDALPEWKRNPPPRKPEPRRRDRKR